MIIGIILLVGGLVWLLVETRCLTIRLAMPPALMSLIGAVFGAIAIIIGLTLFPAITGYLGDPDDFADDDILESWWDVGQLEEP